MQYFKLSNGEEPICFNISAKKLNKFGGILEVIIHKQSED